MQVIVESGWVQTESPTVTNVVNAVKQYLTWQQKLVSPQLLLRQLQRQLQSRTNVHLIILHGTGDVIRMSMIHTAALVADTGDCIVDYVTWGFIRHALVQKQRSQ